MAGTTAQDDEEQELPAAVISPSVLEPNNFALRPEPSLVTPQMTPHEAANEVAHDDENPGEHAPYDTAYPQLSGIEEDWWTGTN